MNMDKLPRWFLWVVATLLLWAVWIPVLGHPLSTDVEALKEQHRETEAELTKLEARMSAVPDLVKNLAGATRQLDSTLDGFATDSNIDALLRDLRHSGGQRGLTGVRVDPELTSLLPVPAAASAPNPNMRRFDTVMVNLAASGSFNSIGVWLDEIERRSDFRYWTMCNWSAAGDDGLVDITALAAMVTVKEPDTGNDIVNMGSDE